MASDLGAEYMELVRRAYHRGPLGRPPAAARPVQQLELHVRVAYARAARPADEPRRGLDVPRADPARRARARASSGLATPRSASRSPTSRRRPPHLIGFDDWPGDRDGTPLPIATSRPATPPKVVVTFVIDGGGWNVLDSLPDELAEPQAPDGRGRELSATRSSGRSRRSRRARTRRSARARSRASTGSPATTSATGKAPRKAYGTPGHADPGDILVPTLADLWSDQTDNRAWVGEIGYQVWHMGMLGYGGRNRPPTRGPSACTGTRTAADGGSRTTPTSSGCRRRCPGSTCSRRYARRLRGARLGRGSSARAGQRQSPCCSPPIVRYQGDLLEATFDSEPIGQGDETSLLYTTFKSPDYTGHVYGMFSDWTGPAARGRRRGDRPDGASSSRSGSRASTC